MLHRFESMSDPWRREAEKALRSGKTGIAERRRGAGSWRPCDRAAVMFPHLARLERARAVDAFGHDPQLLLPAGPQAVALLPAPAHNAYLRPIRLEFARLVGSLARELEPGEVIFLPQSMQETLSASELVEAAARKKAPVQPAQIDSLLMVVSLAVRSGRTGPLYDGYELRKTAGIFALVHPKVEQPLTVGIRMDGEEKPRFVSKRGEIRAFMVKAQNGKAPAWPDNWVIESEVKVKIRTKVLHWGDTLDHRRASVGYGFYIERRKVPEVGRGGVWDQVVLYHRRAPDQVRVLGEARNVTRSQWRISDALRLEAVGELVRELGLVAVGEDARLRLAGLEPAPSTPIPF